MPTQQETGKAQGGPKKVKSLPLQWESIYLECVQVQQPSAYSEYEHPGNSKQAERFPGILKE